MNQDQLFSFRNLATVDEALEIVNLLSKNDINSSYKKDSGDLDFVLQGEAPSHKFEVLINESDRERAEAIMYEKAVEYLADIPKDYYLFEFTDSELKDVLIQKNEWSELDVLLSHKILIDRNVNIDPTEIENAREDREKELTKPEGGQGGWIVFGYISAFFGGFFGLLIGYFIWQAKNKLPNGTKVYSYNEATRNHGKYIFIISAVIFPIMLIARLSNDIASFSFW